MARVELDSGLIDHRKTIRAAAHLRVERYQIVGLLACLWLWCREHAPDGNLVRMNDAEIALAAGWRGDAGLFVRAITQETPGGKPGFLERRGGSLWVHDVDDWLAFSERRRRRQSDSVTTNDANDQNGDNGVTHLSPSGDKPVTSPHPSPSSREPDTPLLSYPTAGKTKTWGLTQVLLSKFSEMYPAVDVLQVCRRALFWAEQNPKRRKTAARMATWLENVWLSKEQNSGRNFAKDSNDDAEYMRQMAQRAASKPPRVVWTDEQKIDVAHALDRLFILQDRRLNAERKAYLAHELMTCGAHYEAVLRGISSIVGKELDKISIGLLVNAARARDCRHCSIGVVSMKRDPDGAVGKFACRCANALDRDDIANLPKWDGGKTQFVRTEMYVLNEGER